VSDKKRTSERHYVIIVGDDEGTFVPLRTCLTSCAVLCWAFNHQAVSTKPRQKSNMMQLDNSLAARPLSVITRSDP
jgi:hypothetical protein